MEEKGGLKIIEFTTQDDWETWLDHVSDNPKHTGIWMKIAKKHNKDQKITVTYDQALDSALCYGWIDGQRASYDSVYFLQRFTPRRTRSIWSKVNRNKVTVLTKNGKMKPGGLLQIELAKNNGRWDSAY